MLQPLPERLRMVERVAIERGDDRFVSGLHANYLSVNLPVKAMRAGAEAFIYYDRIMLAVSLRCSLRSFGFPQFFYA